MTVQAQEYPRDRWTRLGEALKRQRIALGFGSLAAFNRAAGPGRVAISVLRTMESGRAHGYNPQTILRIEHLYKLEEGAILGYLSEADRVLRAAPARQRSRPAQALLAQLGIDPAELTPAIRALRALRDASAAESADDTGDAAGRVASG
jgi:hypothetical protein